MKSLLGSMNILEEINITLPHIDFDFENDLLSILASFGTNKGNKIEFSKSRSDYKPSLTLGFSQISKPTVTLQLENDDKLFIELVNKTGINKSSPHRYSSIDLKTFIGRVGNAKKGELDHLGCNFPWFGTGIHPEIEKARELLKNNCLYYRFPTGEPWDFIIPGTIEEILAGKGADLNLTRRPKFEIVTFDKASKPILQIDFTVNIPYKSLVKIFPEAIHDNGLKNVWVYISNPYNVDICLVVGEGPAEDWSNYFRGHRIQ